MFKTSNFATKNFFEVAFKKRNLTKEREEVLLKIAESIAKDYSLNEIANLNFICTHNSRRSQLGQVWSFYAAEYFNLNINAYSGGTAVTAFYRNTVKTLQKVGFVFKLIDFSHQNPKYQISFDGSKKTIFGFSKLYDDIENKKSFFAITTCNNADANCPYISAAINRFHLPFVDPKHSDGTEKQEDVYLETNKQIAGEIYFIFSQIKQFLS